MRGNRLDDVDPAVQKVCRLAVLDADIADYVEEILTLCDEVDDLRTAIINVGHSPSCAAECKHGIHECDCGWHALVDPWLPTADDVRGILADPGA